jgi:hypothetical protein
MEVKSIQGNSGTLFKINKKLIVNFTSLVYYGKLFNNFVIQHYIAFDVQKFGYFYKNDVGNTSYHFTNSDKVEIQVIPYALDISHFVEDKSIRPTAALVYPNSKFITTDVDTYKIIPITDEN